MKLGFMATVADVSPTWPEELCSGGGAVGHPIPNCRNLPVNADQADWRVIRIG